MPFKSEAQKKKLEALVKEGKFSKEKFKEWSDATPSNKKLPERLTPKKPGESKVKISKIKTVSKVKTI